SLLYFRFRFRLRGSIVIRRAIAALSVDVLLLLALLAVSLLDPIRVRRNRTGLQRQKLRRGAGRIGGRRREQMNRLIADRSIGNRYVNAFADNQYLFQAVPESAERNVNLLLRLSLTDRRHLADRQALWENSIVPRGQKPLP